VNSRGSAEIQEDQRKVKWNEFSAVN